MSELNLRRVFGSRVYLGISALLVIYMAGVGLYAALRESPDARAQREEASAVKTGQVVYMGHCASCHGRQLEGQPEWRRPGADGRMPAPPHDETGHTWHHPDDYLIHVVEQGIVAGVDRPVGYEGNMPAFGAVLSHVEVLAVLAYIKNAWPYDHRAWQAALNAPVRGAPPADSAGNGRATGIR